MWIYQWLRSRFNTNFGKVSETVYRSAQPNVEKLARWKREYHLDGVLDLRDVEDGEQQVCATLGLLYYHIRMRDDQAPSPVQIREALDILQSGITVLVHCVGGRHRCNE